MKTIHPAIQQSINPSAASIRLFASSNSWIEGEALRQFYATAKLEGVRLAVGFPDLHAGKGSAVGAAFVTEGVIYPYVIGSDIGCGMALFKTDLVQRDMKLDRWAELPFDLENPWHGEVNEILASADLESSAFDSALGTVGGGNHFAELQKVEEVFDVLTFKQLGLGKQQLVILVHSGSRGLGESILRAYVDEHQASGSEVEAFAAITYLQAHDHAVAWAKANRALIAKRFAGTIGAEAECLWDGCHNSMTRSPSRRPAETLISFDECDANQENDVGLVMSSPAWIHRKGAVAVDSDFVVIPGSRGALSYLVKPTGEPARHAWSLAHGAGRKWSRSEARRRMRERFEVRQLVHTGLGSRVVCEDRELLYEEAPAAYKNIDTVIQDLVEAGLVSVVATFRPLLTYKTRKIKR
jgi:release factor H-coupled RctB family protein